MQAQITNSKTSMSAIVTLTLIDLEPGLLLQGPLSGSPPVPSRSRSRRRTQELYASVPLRTALYLLLFALFSLFCISAPSAIKRSQVGRSCCGSRMQLIQISRLSPGKGMPANL